jgi:hypothetical protein
MIVLFCGIPGAAYAQELYMMPEDKESRWVSFENLNGAKGRGGMENQGAKGHAFDKIPAGQSINLVDINGSGSIRRIWLTFSDRSPEMLRSLRIDMYWDGSDKPAVSAPIGDFFGIGLGKRMPFENALFSDPEGRSFNCNIPMPFKESARITLTNESEKDLVAIFYDVNLLMETHGEDMLYFHTYWGRANPTTLTEDFEILPKVAGNGRFLGTNIGVRTNKAYKQTWFGEGEVKIYLEGDTDYPTLVGSGTEDYIGTSYGQGVFAHRYQGSPIANPETGEFAFYRYHIPDPIFFRQDIRVSIQQIGGAMKEVVKEFMAKGAALKPVSIHNDEGFHKLMSPEGEVNLESPDLPDGWTNFYRQDDVSATAYFYLNKAASRLPELPAVAERVKDLK